MRRAGCAAQGRLVAEGIGTAAACVLALGFSGACAQGGWTVPEQIRNAPASPAAPDLVAIAKASDIVFVGTVLERGDPPGYWSGRAPAYQILKYRVDDVLRGSVGGGAVAVGHLVVAGAREAEPGDVPALSSTMFAKGARLLVLAVRTSEGRWVGYNSVCGGVPYDADLVARVRAALASTTTDSERPTANHHDER